MEGGIYSKVEYILHDNAENKKFIVLSILSTMDTEEEAVQKLTFHLRSLSRVCDKSLANVDLDVIRDHKKPMEEVFLHYATLFEKQEKSKRKNANKNRNIRNREKTDREFREMALEEIGKLKFAEKLSDYEDRIMNMVKQYYIVQSAKPKADAKLKRAKMKLQIRQIDLRLFQRSFHKVLRNVKMTSSANVSLYSILHNARTISPILKNEFKKEENNVELETNDLSLGQEIKRFLEETESVYKLFMTDENQRKVSEKYYFTIRCLLMHITCQARQYWDAATAVDVLVEMKNTLQSVNEEINSTIEEYYRTTQSVRNTCASIHFLKRLIPRTPNPRSYSEEVIFFNNFDNYFD